MKNSVLIGDCKDVLKSFEDGSIDCIVTDPLWIFIHGAFLG